MVRGTNKARCLLALAVAGLLVLLLPGAAQAQRPFQLGFADDRFADNLLFTSDERTRKLWAGRIADANANLVRLNVWWRLVAPGPEPANPQNPNDQAYKWEEIDRAVKSSVEAGLEPILMVFSAPDFAEGGNRPPTGEVRSGAWRPSPVKLRQFATAIATRYSGTFPDPTAPLLSNRKLPRVTYYEAWNEPNLRPYVAPQRVGRTNTSPTIYRSLLNAFYDGVKSVSRQNKVIVGGTSPFGDRTGDRRIPPVEFWRDVLCLKNDKKLSFKANGCPSQAGRARFDILAHNSIAAPGDPPGVRAAYRDDATAADMHKLRKVLRAAEKHGTVQPPAPRRELWSTELWFESSPPERKKFALGLKKHADAVAEVQYLLWKQGVSAGIFLQIRDSQYKPGGPAVVGLQSGVYFHPSVRGGRAKPALASATFPFVVDRVNKRRVVLWSRVPAAGQVIFERKAGKRWRPVARVSASRRGAVATKRVALRGKAQLRARLGSGKSRAWRVGKR